MNEHAPTIFCNSTSAARAIGDSSRQHDANRTESGSADSKCSSVYVSPQDMQSTLTLRFTFGLAATSQDGDIGDVLRLYTQALMVQISQGTACNRAHSIEQRCARWLLLTHDRVRKDQHLLTQEFLGQMLGVRRASVGQVAASLQRAGCIRYSRCVITILDRKRLEAASCICYSIIRKEYDRLLRD